MEQRYTLTAILLHWLMAAGLVATFVVGYYMEGLPFSPGKLQLIAWHKWAGIALLAVVVFRLVWRLTHRAPRLPHGTTGLSALAAHGGHWLLYILMFVVPLTGWLASSAKGVPVVWLGIWKLPDLVGKDQALGSFMQDAHMVLNYLLAVVVVGHVVAALHHHFIKKDGLMARMWPLNQNS